MQKPDIKFAFPQTEKDIGLAVHLLRDAADVARILRPEEPVICFSRRRLVDTATEFTRNFPGTVSYAIKTNPSARVLQTLIDVGITTFDTASITEIALVKECDPSAKCHYHNPIKSRTEIARAYNEFGVRRFAVDHRAELDKICDVTGSSASVEIAVRFRIDEPSDAIHAFTSKFGALPEDAQSILRKVAERGMVPILTFHPGSQCLNPNAYARHIAVAAEIARQAGVTLQLLNIGGGFPARYPGTAIPPLSDFFAIIEDAITAAFPDERPHIECEPGRAMVADAFSLLAQVKLVKPATREVYLNDGIYGMLMEYTQTQDLIPPCRIIDARSKANWPVTLYGPTCDPLDRLPRPMLVPRDIADGDYIEFGNAGAYGEATITRFNGYGSYARVSVETVL